MANKKQKGVSFKTFKAAVNKELVNCSEYSTVSWNDIEIQIKYFLTLPEIIAFVNKVADAAFSVIGEYAPERVEPAIMLCTVALYTNIELGDDVVEVYNLIGRSSLSQVIMANIDREQYELIIRAINKKISNITSANTQAIISQMNEMGSAIEGIEANFSALFGGIKPEDLTGVISALSSGTLDEQKLVEAIANRQ